MKKIDKKKKNLSTLGAICGVILLVVCAVGMGGLSTLKNTKDTLENIIDPGPEITWQPVMVVENGVVVLGEYPQTEDSSGWLSTFWLDYAENPAVRLGDNTTTNGSTGVRGYCEEDDSTNHDLKSEDPAYPVVRCKFNRTHLWDAGEGCFIGSRARVTLTMTGDETILRTIYCNNSADTEGGGIESDNVTTNGSIYINFYWDDEVDGYRITDDGSLTWSIVIEAKY